MRPHERSVRRLSARRDDPAPERKNGTLANNEATDLIRRFFFDAIHQWRRSITGASGKDEPHP